MGNVQGDKKLNTPAMNASRVRATIPESGKLGLGWKGFSGADFETVDSVAAEERGGLGDGERRNRTSISERRSLRSHEGGLGYACTAEPHIWCRFIGAGVLPVTATGKHLDGLAVQGKMPDITGGLAAQNF